MKNCPKCAGKMSEGYIPDFSNKDYSFQSVWVEGQPKKSLWTGTKAFYKTRLEIKTFRCVNCGYLESYAIDEK